MKPDININYQSLFESAPGLYLILLPDTNFTIVAVSDAYANATMTRRSEIIGKGLFEVFPDNPDDPMADGVSNLRTSLNKAMKNKTAHTMAVQKYDIRRPDGTFEVRYWSPLNKPVLNSKMEIQYIIHRVEDVTDFIRLRNEQERKDEIAEGLRRQVEEMEMEIYKRSSEIQLKNTLDKLLEGVQIIGFDWKYLYVNDSLAKQGQYPKEELIGHTMMEKYPGIEKSEVFKNLERCMKERIPQYMENKFTFPNGSEGWFELSIQPVPEGIFILSIDISERKKAYERLVQSEAEIRNFAKHLNEAMEDERRRLAREIHDELGQQLAGLKIGLSSVKKQAASGQMHSETMIQEMMNEVDNTIQSLRKIATELRPGILDTLGLAPSLQWLGKEFEKKTGTKCKTEIHSSGKFYDNNISICFFRICQEALTNISKHAQASVVLIECSDMEEKITLNIKDNGKGIAGDKLANPFSMGLLGMRERAKSIGAVLDIFSKKNEGTIVHLELAAIPNP